MTKSNKPKTVSEAKKKGQKRTGTKLPKRKKENRPQTILEPTPDKNGTDPKFYLKNLKLYVIVQLN